MNKRKIIFLLIIFGAFLLRIFNIYGQPPRLFSETIWIWSRSLTYIPTFSDKYVFYPALFQVFLLVSEWLIFSLGYFFGFFNSIINFDTRRLTDLLMFITAGRLLVIFFSLGAVILTYKIAKKIKNPDVGLVAMLFLSCNCFYLQESRYLYYNVPVVFFILLGFLFILDVFSLGRKRDYILAGLTLGIGTALNYQQMFLAVPFFVAHFFRQKDTVGLFKRIFGGKLWLSFTLAVFSFILCSPYVIWQFNTFLERLSFNLARLNQATRFESAFKVNGYLDYFVMFFKQDCLFLLLAILGVWQAIRNKKGILLLSFSLFFYACYGAAKEVHPEWIVALVPFLALFAACFLVDLVDRVTGSLKNRKFLLFLFCLIIVTPSLISIAKADFYISQKDIGSMVKSWVAQKTSKETKLLNTDMQLTNDLPILAKINSSFFSPDFKEPIMDTYKGATVMIFGRVIFKEYQGELITVSLRSKNFYLAGPPDIAMVKLNAPGKYSILAPVDTGEVILRATIWPSGTLKKPGYCSRDISLKVGKFDIQDINIFVSSSSRVSNMTAKE